jgi:aminoglycoside 6'-N-acetyltransferase I
VIRIALLGPDDRSVLDSVDPDLFDLPVQAALTEEFLADPRHHIAVAIESKSVVGFASAVHYVHPDKQAELWINEVGVAGGHRRRGIARRLLTALLEHADALGCREAWVLTERDNLPAMALYESAGGREAPDDVVMFSFGVGDQAR